MISYVYTNPSRNRSFSKSLFNREEFENAGFSFSCERKTFYENDDFFIDHKSKTTGACCALKFLRPSVDGKYSRRFRVKFSFSARGLALLADLPLTHLVTDLDPAAMHESLLAV